MPNHWETSARPLFVKTVFVNGNRHAILFEEDPLRSANSLCKRISRSNSSVSFESDYSTTSSESKDSSFELFKEKPKDLSAELQDCLVKLKLVSGSLENQIKARQEKCFCNLKERKKSPNKEKESLKVKRHKWNHEKGEKRKSSADNDGCKILGNKNTAEKTCYVYNVENFKGKKKYCFVKISSQPPRLILNCTCTTNNINNNYHSNSSAKNLLISATIHNLVWSSDRNELNRVFPMDRSEIYWNNYLTTTFYNSLAERVFRWLDLSRKRKKEKENLNLPEDLSSENSTERIFSGMSFVEKIKNGDYSLKSNDHYNGTEFKNDENVVYKSETQPNRPFSAEGNFSNVNASNLINTDYVKTEETKQNIGKTPDFDNQISSQVRSSLKIQDLLLNYNQNNDLSFREQLKRRTKELQNPLFHTENKNYIVDKNSTKMNEWERKTQQNSTWEDKFDSNKQLRCHCRKDLDEYTDKRKSRVLTAGFAERNQKSINNLNNTQTRPVLIQNVLSPQQHKNRSYSQEENIIWASEKNTGRPQLHIFMPSVVLKDHNEDSMDQSEQITNT